MAFRGVNAGSSTPPAPPSQPNPPRRTRSSLSFDDQPSHPHPHTLSRRLSFQRHNASDRINHILEVARERAEAMGANNSTSHPNGRHMPGPDRVVDEYYSSADEHTGIMSRASDRQYQSITTSSPSALSSARMRNSTASSRNCRPAENGPEQRMELPPPTAVPDTDEDDDYDNDERRNGASDRRNRREKKRDSRSGSGRPWYHHLVTHFASIELENKGSVARDHLALERTFLAWLRTSLAFASIGVAITQLFRLNTSLGGITEDDPTGATLRRLGKPLGATFLGISIVILFLGYHRYFHAQRWIIAGKFPASRGTIIGVAFIALAVMIASLVVVIVVHPGDREL